MKHHNAILSRALLNPEATHEWTFALSKPQTRRIRSLCRLFLKNGIMARIEDYCLSDGTRVGRKLLFPCRDFVRAEQIADACYVGESWWPTKASRPT
jgi:hypothetical protein